VEAWPTLLSYPMIKGGAAKKVNQGHEKSDRCRTNKYLLMRSQGGSGRKTFHIRSERLTVEMAKLLSGFAE